MDTHTDMGRGTGAGIYPRGGGQGAGDGGRGTGPIPRSRPVDIPRFVYRGTFSKGIFKQKKNHVLVVLFSTIGAKEMYQETNLSFLVRKQTLRFITL